MNGPLVVKLGGTTIADDRAVLAQLPDVARRGRVVVVHGGGKRLTEWLGRLGVESRFEDGLRITDEAALEVACAVLGGLVSAELVAALRALGVDAIGLRGVDGGLLRARRIAGLGLVGSVVEVRTQVLEALFAVGLVPVVAPVALDEDGCIVNVNADDAAAALAAGLGARLVLLTDVEGVRDAGGRLVERLTADRGDALIANGIIRGGMLPKIRAGLAALAGASEVVIADGRRGDALVAALDDDSFGTRLTRDGAA